MSTPTRPTPTEITFEDGYRRLQEIAERVSSEEVPVHEMCDLFAEQGPRPSVDQLPGRADDARRGDRARRGHPGLPRCRARLHHRGHGRRLRRGHPVRRRAANTTDLAPAPTQPTTLADDDIPY